MSDTRSAETSAALDWPRVRDHLARHGLQLDPAPAPRQFAGGLANINYLVHLSGQPAVLRRPPPGPLPPGAHDMAREHRLLSRLPDALPFVPRGLHLCTDPDVIGVPFQIIEYRAGRTVRATLPPDLAGRPEVGTALSATLLRTLAAIHAVSWWTAGLGQSAQPSSASGSARNGGSTKITGPFEDARNVPVPMRVMKPGTIDCLRSSVGANPMRLVARIVRLPSSRS